MNQNLRTSPNELLKQQPDTAAIMELENERSSGVYAKRPVVITRGKNATLWDSEGISYIDCVGGQGSANIGHANPLVAQAVAEQARTLIACPEIFYNDQRALLEEKLCEITGMERVFLSNSGAEAVEAAIKFARLITGRQGVIAAMRGFHGRTMGALSATWEKKYRKPFEPLISGFQHIPYNNLDALEKALDDNIAAVILEVIQGEGGVRAGSREFLQGAAQICLSRGVLLIIDEIQTGFGRTGRMFAHQHFKLKPDILCLAKSIAGGLPMGATLLAKHIGKLPYQSHSSTFGGGPLLCVAALATIQFIEERDLPGHAAETGSWFLDELRQIESPLIREVRGMGLMVGVELKKKVTPYLKALMDDGVLALSAGLTVLRFLPPLVITQAELKRVVKSLQTILQEEL